MISIYNKNILKNVNKLNNNYKINDLFVDVKTKVKAKDRNLVLPVHITKRPLVK